MDKLLTLTEWAEKVYGDNPPSLETLRRWARDCRIFPVPERHGRSYYLPASARFQIEAPRDGSSLRPARFVPRQTKGITAGRPRGSRTEHLPTNLYERSGYFSWRDPRDGKEYGLGRDRRTAITQAIEANHEVEGTRGKRSLVDRLVAGKDTSMAAWCDIYLKLLEARGLAANSMKVFRSRLSTVRAHWPDHRIDSITTRDVADFIDKWETQGKKRMASAMRSFLLDLFKAAQAKGWVDSNPVAPTRAPTVEVQRARLTLEDFRAIHAVAMKEHAPWLARVMELALVTGQRREDLATMGPRDVRDGKLWIIPKKTEKHGMRICIPLDLRLQAVNWSVGEVIARCHDKVLSPRFIHHNGFAGRAKPGDGIRPHTITMWFAEARDKTGRTWPDGSTPPSFHEIRSLAARLYHEQGINAQMLLCHKSPAMTARYCDSRGSDWIEVKPT